MNLQNYISQQKHGEFTVREVKKETTFSKFTMTMVLHDKDTQVIYCHLLPNQKSGLCKNVLTPRYFTLSIF